MFTFIRLPEVRKITGIGNSTLYYWMEKGLFPKPMKLGSRVVAWDEEEVRKWQEAAMARRDAEQLRSTSRTPKKSLAAAKAA